MNARSLSRRAPTVVGKGNVILFPVPADRIGETSGQIRTRERLGGLLKFYHREAA